MPVDNQYQNDLVQIGKKLIELRKSKGYTSHSAFVTEFKLPTVQYWRMEKGRSNFTIKSLAKILAIHNLTVEQFFVTIKWPEEKRTRRIDNAVGEAPSRHTSSVH